MSLIECPFCKNIVSSETHKCPFCGTTAADFHGCNQISILNPSHPETSVLTQIYRTKNESLPVNLVEPITCEPTVSPEPLGMAWYNFLRYILLPFNILTLIGSAIYYFTGPYVLSTAGQIVIILVTLTSIIFDLSQIIGLSKYLKNAELYCLFAPALHMISAFLSLITERTANPSEEMVKLIIAGIVLGASSIYFQKRKHLFNKPGKVFNYLSCITMIVILFMTVFLYLG